MEAIVTSLDPDVRSVVSGRDFFDIHTTRKIFSTYLPASKELVVMDLAESDNPHIVDIKKLSSPQLKIDSKTAVVQKSDGTVYFTGGFDEGRNRSHNFVA